MSKKSVCQEREMFEGVIGRVVRAAWCWTHRSAVSLQTLVTMDSHISLTALLPSPTVLIIPSIYFSLCFPLALQPGILST